MENFSYFTRVQTPFEITDVDPDCDAWIESFIKNSGQLKSNYFNGFSNLHFSTNEDQYQFHSESEDFKNLSSSNGTYLFHIDPSSLSNNVKEEKIPTAQDYSISVTPICLETSIKLSIDEYNIIENQINKISTSSILPISNENKVSKVTRSKKIPKMKKSKKSKFSRESERLKNIVKNYGKKCANFAISKIGQSILKEKFTTEEFSQFKQYIRMRISKITNIRNFRDMLLVLEEDSLKIAKFKESFQYVSEIFIRNYAICWIFHSSRMSDVKGHIYARHKMLRRIQDPKNFTYIH